MVEAGIYPIFSWSRFIFDEHIIFDVRVDLCLIWDTSSWFIFDIFILKAWENQKKYNKTERKYILPQLTHALRF